MTDYRTILVEELPSELLSITLARPQQLNALNMEMMDELYHIASIIKTNKNHKAVLLKGEGRAFCSGGDLKAFQQIVHRDRDEIEQFIAKFLRFSKTWYELPVPTIACLHGSVTGGGASLALASDLRIAAEDTKFQFVFSKIGLVPDMGAHYLLPKVVGEAKALELLYLGKPISSTEAEQIGLINKVVPTMAQLENEAIHIGNQLTKTSATSNQIIKQLVKRSSALSLDEVLNYETYFQTECFKTNEFQTYIQSFFK